MSNLENESGFNYWFQWQVPVCALIIIIPPIISLVLIYKSRKSPLNVYDLWVPCWKNLNPIWMLIYRASVVFIMSCFLSVVINIHGAFAFYFYTQWTFALVILYFVLGTIFSAQGCWVYLKTSKAENEEGSEFLKREGDETESNAKASSGLKKGLNKLMKTHHDCIGSKRNARFGGYLMLTVYQTSAGAVLLTDIVFWCILVPFLTADTFRVTRYMACMHSLNFVFFLLDVALNKLPFHSFGLVYFLIWSGAYTVFQWILHACGFTWWPYPFLELSTPWAPLWYFALTLVHIPCYSISPMLIWGHHRA
ncbi:uncharacterized protein LOC113346999 [Papaver somniferum]|uniref:uncharacterized protein LOC113346999 n=1 Tax=Papaver somniferum TaxID=3469 RepID=UPI000E6F70EF|nr:uncharacterized protein LOC113346999 [Papaver somniferum]